MIMLCECECIQKQELIYDINFNANRIFFSKNSHSEDISGVTFPSETVVWQKSSEAFVLVVLRWRMNKISQWTERPCRMSLLKCDVAAKSNSECAHNISISTHFFITIV